MRRPGPAQDNENADAMPDQVWRAIATVTEVGPDCDAEICGADVVSGERCRDHDSNLGALS
jgi:hypothetical protein